MTLARGIVFDLDGTLVDSVADITQALNHAFARAALSPVTVERVRPAIGDGALELVRRVAPAGAGDALVQELCRVYLDAYAADPAPHARLFADAGEALPALHERGIALGVCTNKPTELSRLVLRAVGLADAISVVRGRDATRFPKPDPRHLLETVAELGLSPGAVVYVGDNPIDIAVAHDAGVLYRHVAWGVPVPGDVPTLERFAELAWT